MKATHYGTCQICARKQKAPDGLVAKHGYTVDGGFFSGTCFGSDEQPFEKDRSVLGLQIERLIKNIEERKVHLDGVKTGKEPVLAFIRFENPNCFARSEGAWVHILAFTEEGIVFDKNDAPYNKEPSSAYYPREVKTNEDGNWVISKDCDWYDDYVTYLDRRISKLTSIVRVMEVRYDNWKLTELEAVA